MGLKAEAGRSAWVGMRGLVSLLSLLVVCVSLSSRGFVAMASLWPVTVRFVVKMVLKGVEDREYVVTKPLLASSSFEGLRNATLKANLDTLPGELAEIAGRPVLAQTTAKILRLYTKSLSNEPGEAGTIVESEVTSDFAYGLMVAERRTLYVKVGLVPTEGARVGIKRELLCTSKSTHDTTFAKQAHTSSDITAGIRKSLSALLSTSAVQAPDNLYGIKVDGCVVKCVCPFRTTTNKGRLHDTTMGVEGHLVKCVKLLSRLPVPVKQKLEALAVQRKTDSKERRLRHKKAKVEAQKKKDNTRDIRGMLAGAVVRPVVVNHNVEGAALTVSRSSSDSKSKSDSDSDSNSESDSDSESESESESVKVVSPPAPKASRTRDLKRKRGDDPA